MGETRYLDCLCGDTYPTGDRTEDCPVYKLATQSWMWYVYVGGSDETRTAVYKGLYKPI